jgi:hypothetical protein
MRDVLGRLVWSATALDEVIDINVSIYQRGLYTIELTPEIGPVRFNKILIN